MYCEYYCCFPCLFIMRVCEECCKHYCCCTNEKVVHVEENNINLK